jgi:hypothetical protein
MFSSTISALRVASVGSLQTWEYAADLAGLSTEALTNSVSKLNQKPAEAARTGTGAGL